MGEVEYADALDGDIVAIEPGPIREAVLDFISECIQPPDDTTPPQLGWWGPSGDVYYLRCTRRDPFTEASWDDDEAEDEAGHYVVEVRVRPRRFKPSRHVVVRVGVLDIDRMHPPPQM